MKNWETHFSNKILDRGYDYYQNDDVYDLVKNADSYRAFVAGMENYEVTIECQGEKVSEMWCDCPHAAQGNNCKHMAAVLFAIEEKGERLTEESGGSSTAEELINQLSPEQLRAALLYLCQKNHDISSILLARYSPSVSAEQITALKKEFSNLVQGYTDRYGYIERRGRETFENAVETFLETKVDPLIQRQFSREAFDLLSYCFSTLSGQVVDDYGEAIGAFLSVFEAFFLQILEQADATLKQEMFIWFNNQHSLSSAGYFEKEMLLAFLENHFQEKEYLEARLNVLNKHTETLLSRQSSKEVWGWQYELAGAVRQSLKLMERLDYDDEKIDAYQKKFWFLSDVRELAIEKALSNGNLTEAQAILQESKRIDNASPGLVSRYSRQLMSIYQQQNDKEAYKKELIAYLFEMKHDDREEIDQLKEISSEEEWLIYRERLLSQMSFQSRLQFLKQEGLYQRLLDEILDLRFNRPYFLDKYETVLKQDFPEIVRDAYIDDITQDIVPVSDRKTYRELVQYLKKIATYPDGDKLSRKIANDWKSAYPRRRALQEELRTAGF